ncbi:hypothetical protein FACS1894169_15850 [Bacteroidia bacterium]|nr:hypothetical protein FACS1894169_15850 [Bacteroidia bacterium]
MERGYWSVNRWGSYSNDENPPVGYERYMYGMILSFSRLKSKQTILTTDNSSSVTVSEEYTYYDPKNTHIQKVTRATSNASEKRIEEYKYPQNYTDAIYTAMVAKNMTAPVVEQISYGGTDGTLETKRVKTNYTNTSTITNGLILPASIQTSASGTNGLLTEVNFNKYDSRGNLLQATLKDGSSISYLWSYNYQYPIAEIKNATLSEVNAVLSPVFGVASADALSALATPNETKLKDGSLQKALPGALITTYTYKPLIGMLTATDPSGIITYYAYDSFGRLKEAYTYKDNIVSAANKQIVQSYDYHYQNQ